MAVTPEGNLALIEELQKLVGAKNYEPVDGPEFSYPAVGQAVDDEMWRFVTLALGNGILDEGGQPYFLEKLGTDYETNSSNQMRLTVSKTAGNAQALLNGFYHRMLQDMPLDFPMPLSETTYYVTLELNPLKASDPEGPISVQVYPNEVNTESGRQHMILWKLIRKPNQLLTEATIQHHRPKVAPTLTVDRREMLPSPSSVIWGTRFLIHSTREEVMAWGSNSNGKPNSWMNIKVPDWNESTSIEFPWAGHGERPSWRAIDDRVELRGRIKRRNDVLFRGGNNYTLIPNCPDSTARTISNGGCAQSGASVNIESNPQEQAKPKFGFKDDEAWVDITGLFYYRS